MSEIPEHYLKSELDSLFQADRDMWSYVQQASLDGVWYWDLENPDNLWISPEYWKCLGYDPATKKHSPQEFINVVFEEDLQKVLENLEQHYADPSVAYEQIVRFRHLNSSTVWVRCRGKATRDQNGKAIRMLGAHNDITALKKSEKEAQDALQDAATANADLRSFAYGLSHDLRSPANTVGMLLEEIISSSEQMSDEQKHLVDIAQRTNNRMRRLVNDMLNYTKLIGHEPEQKQVSLYNVAQEVKESIRSLIIDAGAEMKIDECLPTITGQPSQLSSLLQNLAENAIKYRDPSRPALISITNVKSEEQGTTSISVSDNGVGIAPEYQDNIFEMFKRLHGYNEVPGTGLGLTLCRRVMMNHGGNIKIASELGKGTTFTLSFPEQRMSNDYAEGLS